MDKKYRENLVVEARENTTFRGWVINFYEKKRNYIHFLPLLLIIFWVFKYSAVTMLDYRYESGSSSEVLRLLIISGMIVPVVLLIVYICLIYLYLVYSTFKRRLSKSKLIIAFLIPVIGAIASAAIILYEISGKFDFELFLIAKEHNALFDIFSESLGRSGFIFSLIHLAIFSCFEKKRNSNSMANVLIFWPSFFTILGILAI